MKRIKHILRNKDSYRTRLLAMRAIWQGRPTMYRVNVTLPLGLTMEITYLNLYENVFRREEDSPVKISGKRGW